jgi:hypothetical protein
MLRGCPIVIKYHNVKDPLKEAIEQIIGKEPPFDFGGAYKFNELPPEALNQIEDWCSLEISASGPAEWATGSSVVSAAEIMVEEGQWDANIEANPVPPAFPEYTKVVAIEVHWLNDRPFPSAEKAAAIYDRAVWFGWYFDRRTSLEHPAVLARAIEQRKIDREERRSC